MRVLYIAGEVAPFSETTETSRLIRMLPEAVQESGDIEVRIMMPRYGIVSERRNRLHEVIRLSGTDIAVGEENDILKVKVASIPGIRLQVYFMDSVKFFKRKGLHNDRKSGDVFTDNPSRALYFSRAALATAKKLGWSPDVVHASGWIAGLTPHVLQQEMHADPLFTDVKSVYTPDTIDTDIVLSEADATSLGLPSSYAGKTLQAIGIETADAVALSEPLDGVSGTDLSGEKDEAVESALALYQSLSGKRELAA